MKPFLKSALIFLTLVLFSRCEKDETIGASTSFLNALIHKGVDTNNDGKISSSEAKAVTKLDISNESVTDLGGIGSFSNLDTLICEYNKLTVIDMSGNPRLLYLNCGWNYDLKTLNVSKNRALKHLSCGSHILTVLDVSNNPDLTFLNCPGCGLNTINVSNNLSLEWFGVGSNNLTSLNVSKNKALKSLYCDANQLGNIDISMNPALTTLGCSYNNLTSLNLSQNLLLTDLRCNDNKLIMLPLSANQELQYLSVGGNMLTMLDLSTNTALIEVSIYGMPSLLKFCVVVRPFPLANVSVVSFGSPNFQYSTDCSK